MDHIAAANTWRQDNGRRASLIEPDGTRVGGVTRWDNGGWGALYRDFDGVEKLAGDFPTPEEAKAAVEETVAIVASMTA